MLPLSGRIVLGFGQRGAVSLAFDLEDDRSFDQAVEERHRQRAIYQILCHSRIIKVDLDGKILGVLGSFGKIPGKIDTPHYIAVDSTGAIYAADFRNWRVDKFVKK